MDKDDSDGARRVGGLLRLGADVTGDEPAFTLPTGTVTFLLTDVEGSTRGWETAPDAMALAIPAHYEILDRAIAAHGGVRPVEQGEGDSVVGAFSRASDAVAAALDAQRALGATDWPPLAEFRVRMALHTGEAKVRNAGNYFGETVIRCARLRGIGHGGQILLSETTATLVADQLDDGVTITDLGAHRLRDLRRAERVWQLGHADLSSEFPPLRSLDAFRHNLPVQLTPLVGRTDEAAAVAELLRGNRLVTLTGSGGVGKTRLALVAGAEAVDRNPGGVWWVELAPVSEPGAVGRAALAAMHVPEMPGASLVDQLAVELSEDPSLLVLDNCEHLIGECAELVASLLARTPTLTVLATSREALGVPGEVIWRVPSLGVPPAESPVDVAALSQFDAVRLFIDHARRARPSFDVTEENAPAIALICYRLDGIPLALELAAARCRQLSVDRIAAELDQRFRLLTGGARTVMARQQTLAASVDWSFERLDGMEQRVFRRLGVFAGPFPLEAAESIAASFEDVDRVEVFDLLSQLVDKSLVTTDEEATGAVTYRLLETLRAYALERAREHGELERLRDSHAAWWHAWLDDLGVTGPTDDVIAVCEGFHGNLKAALDWRMNDPELGLRMLQPLARVWQGSGRTGDASVAIDRLLFGPDAHQHASAWMAAANTAAVLVLYGRGAGDLVTMLLKVMELATRDGDECELALAHWLLDANTSTCATLRDDALRHDRWYPAALATTGYALQMASESGPSAAGEAMHDAEQIARTSGSEYVRDSLRLACAVHAALDGDLSRAVELGRELVECRTVLMVDTGVRALSLVSLLACDRDSLAVAVQAADRRTRKSANAVGLSMSRRWMRLLDGEPSEVAPWIADPAAQERAVREERWIAAREAIDAGDAAIAVEAVRSTLKPGEHTQAIVAAIEAAAGDEARWYDALAIAASCGLRLLATDALEGLAVAAARAESWDEAARIAGAASRLRDETGYRWRFGVEQAAYDAALAAVSGAVGDERTNAGIAAGRALDWQAATEYARRARGERKRPGHGWESLTPTERQVVVLVTEGLTNPEIATRLLMGRATVKTHLEHVFAKLGVHSRAEVAAAAARRA